MNRRLCGEKNNNVMSPTNERQKVISDRILPVRNVCMYLITYPLAFSFHYNALSSLSPSILKSLLKPYQERHEYLISEMIPLNLSLFSFRQVFSVQWAAQQDEDWKRVHASCSRNLHPIFQGNQDIMTRISLLFPLVYPGDSGKILSWFGLSWFVNNLSWKK